MRVGSALQQPSMHGRWQCPSIYSLSIHPSVYSSFNLFILLSIHPSIYSSFYLFIHYLFTIYSSIYLPVLCFFRQTASDCIEVRQQQALLPCCCFVPCCCCHRPHLHDDRCMCAAVFTGGGRRGPVASLGAAHDHPTDRTERGA